MLSFVVPRSTWKVALWVAFLAAVVAFRLVGSALLPSGDGATQLHCSAIADKYSSYSCGP